MNNKRNLLKFMSSSAATYQILSQLNHTHSDSCGHGCGHDHHQEKNIPKDDKQNNQNSGNIGEQ